MKIGEILVQRGCINSTQLDLCLDEQLKRGGKVGELMLEQGFLTEAQLGEALEEQLGLPFVSLLEAMMDHGLSHLVPQSIAEQYCLVPIRRIQHMLIVAMDDPLNTNALSLVCDNSGMSVRPVLAAKSAIRSAIGNIYSGV